MNHHDSFGHDAFVPGNPADEEEPQVGIADGGEYGAHEGLLLISLVEVVVGTVVVIREDLQVDGAGRDGVDPEVVAAAEI